MGLSRRTSSEQTPPVRGRPRSAARPGCGVLSDLERAAGVWLSCRAVPLTDIVIELAEGDRLRLAVPVLREGALQAARQARKRVRSEARTCQEREWFSRAGPSLPPSAPFSPRMVSN